MSVLLRGFGSKHDLLNKFAKACAKNGASFTVNGLHPGLTAKQVRSAWVQLGRGWQLGIGAAVLWLGSALAAAEMAGRCSFPSYDPPQPRVHPLLPCHPAPCRRSAVRGEQLRGGKMANLLQRS